MCATVTLSLKATYLLTYLFSRISQDILDQFLQSLHHMKAIWVHMIDLYLIFRFVKGRCQATKYCWENRESNEGGLTAHAFFALAFANEMGYDYVYVRINSSDDQATSVINLVGF